MWVRGGGGGRESCKGVSGWVCWVGGLNGLLGVWMGGWMSG